MSELLQEDANPEEAIEFAKDLLDDIEILREKEDGGELPSYARDFADEVDEKVEGILDWMDVESHVTEKQISTLNGIRGGVDRWLGR